MSKKTMTDWERKEFNQMTVCNLLDRLLLKMSEGKQEKITIQGRNPFTKDLITVNGYPAQGRVELQLPKNC